MIVFCHFFVSAGLAVLDPFGLSLPKPGRYLGTVRAELVEAWACGLGKRAWVRGGGRESPGMQVTFFCFAKRKSPKKRRPPVCDPFAVRRGKPAACRLRGAPWNSLCAVRAARTATASQSTKHGRFDAHATPQPPRRRRSQQGVGNPNIQQPNSPTGHRFARPHLAGASATRCAGEAERSNGPCGCPHPGFPSGCAEERSGQWIRARDCLSAVKRSELERDPAGREHRRLPVAKRRDAACRVALSLVTFFRRDERKLLACRATPGLRPQQKHVAQTSTQAQTSSARPFGLNTEAIKTIANSAC